MRRLFAAIAILVAACELALPIRELAEAGVDAAEAGDDAAPVDANNDGPVNLLQNAGFEQGTIQCGAFWTAQTSNVTLSITDASRTGAQACRVCSSGAGGVQQHLSLRFDAGTHFTGSVWVAPDLGEAGASTHLFVIMHMPDASPNQAYISVNKNVTTWTELSNGVTPLNAVDTIDFNAQLGTADGGCILVDDTSLIAE